MKRVNPQQNGYYETYDCIFEKLPLLTFGNDVIVSYKIDPKTES